MAIITISRGSFSHGKEVAEKVAKRLNYTLVSREVVIEASKEFNVPQITLDRAIHDAPSILERFTYGKQRYMAYIESELLDYFQKDNVVYHGLAGHFFVKNISHVLKVRIVADIEDRIRARMSLEWGSKSETIERLKNDDEQRRQWSHKLYGVDTTDPHLYDLVLHIRKLSVDNAADLICQTVEYDQFKTTPDSQRDIDNLTLAAKVKACLVDEYPNCKVVSQDGEVTVTFHASMSMDPEIVDEVRSTAQEVPGVNSVKVHLIPTTLFQ
jgi:cytidylate kinase